MQISEKTLKNNFNLYFHRFNHDEKKYVCSFCLSHNNEPSKHFLKHQKLISAITNNCSQEEFLRIKILLYNQCFDFSANLHLNSNFSILTCKSFFDQNNSENKKNEYYQNNNQELFNINFMNNNNNNNINNQELFNINFMNNNNNNNIE